MREFLRLLVLHQHGKLTENQWKATLALQSNSDMLRQSDGLDLQAIRADVDYLAGVIKCEMSENDLHELYWRVSKLLLRIAQSQPCADSWR